MSASLPTQDFGQLPLTQDFGQQHFGRAYLHDRRRTRSLVNLADRPLQHPGGSLPDKFHDSNALRRCYDLMNTTQVTHAAVLDAHVQATGDRLRHSHGTVLYLHDITELDFTSHKSLQDDVGQIGNGTGRGYLCHNTLVVTPDKRVLGLANQILHVRPEVPDGETIAQRRERENRETLLGVRAVEQTNANLPATADGPRGVDSCDRAGDTFEFLDREVQRDRLFLVRSKHNRRMEVGHGGGGVRAHLHDYLRTLPGQGTRTITIHDHDRGTVRQAQVQVACAAVRLLVPRNRRGQYQARFLDVWALRVWEPTAPRGVEPVEWFLLTNVWVATVDDSWERVDWYLCRWVVELVYDEQKTHQDPRRPTKPAHLRSETPLGVLQEVYALSLGHFVVRAFMAEAAATVALDPDRLSFLGCLQVLKTRLPECPTESPAAVAAWYPGLLWELSAERTDDAVRRNRINPRVVRQKMSKFKKKRPEHRHLPPLQKTFIESVVMNR